MKGIMLSDNGDLLIQPRAEPDGKLSGVVINETLIQDSAIVLGLNQGEYKEDAALGPNLLRFIRSKADKARTEKQIQIHLKRAGLDYDELKNKINIHLKSS